ncbi:hypothetical protein GGC63_004731 [Paenibacillus sp. OAS669]|nr:hypothetical protein [Paenibacillus sp. OAS669]MBE1445263.1 hypothetical protein [Paenibacillus sp. OAS669]
MMLDWRRAAHAKLFCIIIRAVIAAAMFKSGRFSRKKAVLNPQDQGGRNEADTTRSRRLLRVFALMD